MAIQQYVVVSGHPGVHKLVTTRANGVIILDTDTGKTRFIPAKSTDVTPLGMISVFTETEEGAIALREVFVRMRDQEANQEVPAVEAHSTVHRAYMSAVVPEHDEDRVKIADIKKMVKWFRYMKDKNILDEVLHEPEATETESLPEEEAKA